MLALRAIIRPRLYLNATPSCWFHASPRFLCQPLVRPRTWRARLWYCPDGKPRSKWKGCKVALSAILFVPLYWFSVQVYRILEDQLASVSLLSNMMQLDAKYSSYDLSKRQELVSYFVEVGKIFIQDPEELRKNPDLFRVIGSFLVSLPGFRQQLRNELESIHEVMQSNSTAPPLEAAQAVRQALKAMFVRLVALMEGAEEQNVWDAQTKDQKEDAEVVSEG